MNVMTPDGPPITDAHYAAWTGGMPDVPRELPANPLQAFEQIRFQLVGGLQPEEIVAFLQNQCTSPLNKPGALALLGWAREECARHDLKIRPGDTVTDEQFEQIYGTALHRPLIVPRVTDHD